MPYDIPRTAIALAATVIASAAAVAVGRDTGMAGYDLAAGVFVAGLVLVVFTGARAAGDLAGGHVLPTVLGIASTAWTDIATFGVPLLLAIARSDIPDRLQDRTTG
jgi:hypothetical protein